MGWSVKRFNDAAWAWIRVIHAHVGASLCWPDRMTSTGKEEVVVLIRANDFKHFKLRALDGDIGKAREFYFDDRHWTVRYLVADTGGWLTGRQVLVWPHTLGSANAAERVVSVNLTRRQVEQSPSLTADQQVSRQYEMHYYDYYGWPMYWHGPFIWGAYQYPWESNPLSMLEAQARDEAARHEDAWDPNLRSTRDVTGYHIQALDGEIGHVEDFIIDDRTWAIRYLVVDTKNWLAGRRVLVSPQWIGRLSWEESKVFVSLSRELIKQSPEYTPESLNRDYEAELHQHYDRQGYWSDSFLAQK